MFNKLAFLLLLLLSMGNVKAQNQNGKLKVVPLFTKQSFYLNGGFRSDFGGKSRVVYQVDLPPNTVEWYYAVSTYPSNQGSQNVIALLEQITKLLDPTGVASIALNLITVPSGVNDCDIYLLDMVNQNIFYHKLDQTQHEAISYVIDGSRENFKNGVVRVTNPVRGRYFLGFKNPNSISGIGISFEAVAIVRE